METLRERDPSASKAFDRALELRKEGRYLDALAILDILLERHPAYPTLLGIKGDLHWRLGDLAAARRAFAETVKASPSSQLASLALAEVLIEQGRLAEARLELRRFLRSHESDWHRAELECLDGIRPDDRTGGEP